MSSFINILSSSQKAHVKRSNFCARRLFFLTLWCSLPASNCFTMDDIPYVALHETTATHPAVTHEEQPSRLECSICYCPATNTPAHEELMEGPLYHHRANRGMQELPRKKECVGWFHAECLAQWLAYNDVCPAGCTTQRPRPVGFNATELAHFEQRIQAARRVPLEENPTLDNLYRALHLAAHTGDAAAIRHIAMRHDINCSLVFNGYDGTALHIAAKEGHTECVQALIDAGATIDEQHGILSNYTPLYWAIRNGHIECARLLISSGANTNHRTWGGAHGRVSLLSSTVHYGTTECTQLLLDNGATIEPHITNTEHPLYAAVKKGDTQSVELLIRADANIRNKDRSSLIFLTATKGYHEILKLLIDANVDASPLFDPCAPMEDVIKVSQRERFGITALHTAAEHGYTKCVQHLLNAGADVNSGNGRTGVTPLHAAADAGYTSCVRLLLHAGANVNHTRMYDGISPLCAAARRENIKCARMLIRAGADINNADKYGHSPLFAAIYSYPRSPLFTPIDSYPQNRRPSLSTKLKLLRLLLNNGANIHHRAKDGSTAVSCSVSHDPACLKLVMDAGANIHHADVRGQTPLYHAVVENVTCLKMLIAAGADVNTVAKNGHNALSHAQRWGCKKSVAVLLQAGAQNPPKKYVFKRLFTCLKENLPC